MKGQFMAATLSAFLAGCATPYTESGLFGGFSETPLASDTYRIQASGNGFTSQSKTNSIALVRAAVLAAEYGYDRFVILDYDEWTDTTYNTTPTTATTYSTTNTNLYAHGSAYDVGQYRHADIYGRANSSTTSTTTIHPGETYAIYKPMTDIVVLFVPADAPAAARALRVADVIARYGKIAGYKPKKAATPALAASILPAQPAPAAPVQTASAVAEMEAPSVFVAPSGPPPALAQAAYDPALPTLDEVYKSLSAGEKAHVNRLPPAQRADYLEQIRERRF